VSSVRTALIPAGAATEPIRVQFGYQRDQLPAIYLPLAALALALLLIARSLTGAGFADLNRSVFMLGTIFWMGAASRLQAADPIRILLSGTPLANIVATFIAFCVPLLCVAAGSENFARVCWSYGMFLFPFTSAMAVIPAMADGDWTTAAPWLVAAPISIMLCRWRIRAGSGTSVQLLSAGELKDRVSELAAKAGRHGVKVFISSSMRSQALNAFAMVGNSIVLTAPLVRSLTRREVDAIVGHELSHLGHVRSSPWAALAVAAVLFQTPLADLLVPSGGGWLVAVALPSAVFFATLYALRKREFAADAGSVALTGDPRALISGLSKIAGTIKRPLQVNALVEWFSTHPSTHNRICALAVSSCNSEDPGEYYVLPADDGSTIFNLKWQTANGARYAWAALFGASGAGLLVAWLLDKTAGPGFAQLAGGIILGCAITKVLASSVMSSNYVRLKRKLEAKLGVNGQLVGLAVDNEPRVYNGFRFSDVGFISFQGGRLSYQSERTFIGLNPADVIAVNMLPASPSSWRRLQPMIRFRHPESGDVKAVILHPVERGATPRRLLHEIERWRTTANSADATTITGLQAPAGEFFHTPTIAQTASGFRLPGTVTLVGALLAGWMLRLESWPAWYALIITACAYIFMFLPALLYRRQPLVQASQPA